MTFSIGTALGLSQPSDGAEIVSPALVVSRKINPITRDYVRDADGINTEVDPIETRVLLAVTTIPGDVEFMPSFGDESTKLKKRAADLENRVLRNAQVALADLLKDGSIVLLGVDVISDGIGRFQRTVRWQKKNETYERTTVAR